MRIMNTMYIPSTVNNEVELCEVSNLDCKTLIERALLQNRISYYIRWPKTSWLSRRKNLCIICVNENVTAEAEDIVRTICDESGYQVRFLLKRSGTHYL